MINEPEESIENIGHAWNLELQHISKFLDDLRSATPQSKKDFVDGMEVMFRIMTDKFWNAKHKWDATQNADKKKGCD